MVANNRILAEDHKEAARRLGNLEQKYQDKKDECNTLKIKQVACDELVMELHVSVRADFKPQRYK